MMGAGWGRGLMALLGLPKRAIKPRPHWSYEKKIPKQESFFENKK